MPGDFKCHVKGCHKRYRDAMTLIKHIQTKHGYDVVVKTSKKEG